MPLIVVDATLIGQRSKGAGRALKNLLVELPRVDPAKDYLALVTAAGREQLGAGVESRVVDVGRGIAWELAGVSRAAAGAGADLVFTVRELSPLRGAKSVVHVYEPPAWRLRRPRSSGDVKALAKDALLHAALRPSLRRAAAVTAGSATTADWLARHTGVDAEVVYPGIDPWFLDAGTDEPSPGTPYFLHPASGDSRENTGLVLAAFAAHPAPEARLRLVGLPPRDAAHYADAARRLGIADRVELLGWVTDADLRGLYRDALALIHPTRYESFAGFPALEAMALGTPVVALDAPGSTEALEGAAVLLSREDPQLLADELRRLEQDAALRRDLGDAGRARAQGLTWEESARALAAVFQRVLA